MTNRATARSRSIDRAIASNLDARFDATTTLSIAIDDAAARRARESRDVATRDASAMRAESRARLTADDVVVVVGGGVAGLALASSLARARDGTRGAADAPTCVVLERDGSREARRQGYGVTLSETNAALAGLGVGEALRARSCASSAHWTFAASGRVLGYYGNAFAATAGRGAAFVRRRPRARARRRRAFA